jgi:hypothetical protein
MWSESEFVMLSTLLTSPQRGSEFRIARTVMGLSVRSVARALGCSHSTLLRRESDSSPLPTAVALVWRRALAQCGQERLRDAAKHGLAARALADTELATLTAALKGRWHAEMEKQP